MILVWGTLLVWAVWFALMYVPSYWIGIWLARKSPPNPNPIIYLALAAMWAMCSQLTVLIVVIVVMFSQLFIFGQSSSLQHFNDDPKGFGIALFTALLFIPTFAALIVGYLRARRTIRRDIQA